MPTVSARIDASLSGGTLTGALGTQVANLGKIATSVASLIEQPPSSLADVSRLLNELPLPKLGLAGNYTGALDSIRSAVPGDLSSLTGPLVGGLESLASDVRDDVVRLLQEALGAVLAVYRLTQLDFRCGDTASAGGAAAPPGGGGGGAPPAGGAAPAPSGVAAARAQVESAHQLLDSAPSPFNVEGVLAWLQNLAAFRERGFLGRIPLPLVDEWIEPLETLHAWKAMTPAQVRDHMAASLDQVTLIVRGLVDGHLSALAADVAATAGKLQATPLNQIAADIVAALDSLRAAVASGNLGATGPVVTQLNARLDAYDTLRQQMQGALLNELPALSQRIEVLPQDLPDRMSELLALVSASRAGALLAGLTDPAEVAADALRAKWAQAVQPQLDWVQLVLDQLDLSAVKAPLEQAAAKARQAADTLEQGMTSVTVEVRRLLGEVEGLAAQVDTQAVANQAKQSIEQFGKQIEQQLLGLFGPVRGALSGVVSGLDQQAGQFDPQQIAGALNQAIDGLAGVLQGAEVSASLQQIGGTVQDVADQLESLSFAPITDQVIKVIEELTQALESIDTAKLNPVAQGALQAALVVLPADLTPVTDPLVVQFGGLVQGGPVPLLDRVKQEPKKLLDKVRSFDPAALVGHELSQPYQKLIGAMEQFKPSKLLDPVQGELDKLKDRLRQQANPAAALQALDAPFQQLIGAFDQLKPEQLVKPLEDAIGKAIGAVLDALPVDEVFEQTDAALKPVQDMVGFVQRMSELLTKVRTMLQGFADSRKQVDAWVDAILDKVEAIGNMTPLQTRLTALAAAIDATRAQAIAARYQALSQPLLAALDPLDPQARLVAIVQAHAAVPRDALSALPNSPAKQAVLAVLQRFDPVDPAFGAPYQALARYRDALRQTGSALTGALANWDARYHAADGTLAGLRLANGTPAQVRQKIQEAIEPQFVQPTAALFGLVEAISTPLGEVAGVVEALVAKLQQKVAGVLLGPGSLQAIKLELERLVKRLRDFNLDFLKQALGAVFAQVRGKLAALGPAQLKPSVEQAFETMLSTLRLDRIIAPADVQKLDADYAKIVDKLKALDPEKLVVQVVGPAFKTKIEPLLAAFDLSPLFDAIIARLKTLEGELRAELERVNEKYKALRGAVPSLSLSASVDLSF